MTAPGGPTAPGVDLAVLVNGFPRLSETFVLQELLDLERRGVQLHLFALSRPAESVQQQAVARLRARVEYVPEVALLSRRSVAWSHAALLRRHGANHLAAFARLSREPGATRGIMRRGAWLAERLAQLKAPALYVHFAHKPGTVGRIAARLAGVPYGLSCHAKDIWATPPEELVPKLRDAEVVLTCTVAGRDALAAHAEGATPVRLIHHGVDVDAVVPRRPAPGPPRLLSVGRLVEKKGHDTLIRAAALLRDRGVPFTLRIAEEGVEWPRLQRLVHELDVAAHVTFLGPLSPSEVRTEYASASVFALACRRLENGDRDGLPNVVLEAMVQGLPIVSTVQDGVCEAVQHGRNGLLVAPDDPSALADALASVLSDPGLAIELGNGAQHTARERFDCRRLLPVVATALADAGLIGPAERLPVIRTTIPAMAAA